MGYFCLNLNRFGYVSRLEYYYKSTIGQLLSTVAQHLAVKFDQLHDAELSTENFSFYTSVASVFSSKIEGEPVELDSFKIIEIVIDKKG